MKKHHTLLLSGLGSSACPWRYAAWARELKKRILTHPNLRDVENHKIHLLSSDGPGENAFFDEVLEDYKKGQLGHVITAGHSNGARDQFRGIERLYAYKIPVEYVAVIDMTLGEFGATAFGNIRVLDEFWAGLQTADFDKSFKGTHNFYDLDKLMGKNVGHVEAASLEFVQNLITENIAKVFK